MRRAALPIALLLLLAAWSPPAAAATKKERQRVCAKRGFTVDKSRIARVFAVDHDGDQALYGCLRSTGRLVLLASWFSCGCSIGDEIDPDAELHAGRIVEVTEYESCGPVPEPTCGGSFTSLRDLRTRRLVSAVGDVEQVVVQGRRLAFLDGRVVLVDGTEEHVVDPGPGIERGSLAFSRTRLYWTRDGQPFSAPL